VSVRPESRRKATGDGTVLAIGATPGEAYQAIDWGEAWRFREQARTDDDFAAVRDDSRFEEALR
jgi:hypothetical protein